MNTSNLKDTLTTIAGFLFALASGVLTASASGLVVSAWLTTAAGVIVAVSGGLIGWLTGKSPDAKTKIKDQVIAGNEEDLSDPDKPRPKPGA